MRRSLILLALVTVGACDSDPTGPALAPDPAESSSLTAPDASATMQDPLALALLAGLSADTRDGLPERGTGLAFSTWVRLDLTVGGTSFRNPDDIILLDALALMAEAERTPGTPQ